MSRVSKRKSKLMETRKLKQTDNVFKTAIYARLSSDQDEMKNESIDMQIDIAKRYIEEQNKIGKEHFEIVKIFSDLGKTGTNFERKDFLQMMQEVRLGNINCIIVKDLSRFGRNYLEAGNYIEKIFPFLGVRFISVSDQFDTMSPGNKEKELAVNLKNLMHDLYAKDFSYKAKLHLQQRRERGSYVGGPVPYGFTYKWVERDRVLCPDPNTAPIIRRIFQVFMETQTYAGVADTLNLERINRPSTYKKTGEVYCPDTDQFVGWDRSAIVRILNSKTYIGTLEQGKTSITARDEKNRIKNDPSEWTIREDVHEGIIEKDVFDTVQSIIKEKKEQSKNHKHQRELIPLEECIYDDVLYCGVCGHKMLRLSRVEVYQNGDQRRVERYKCPNSYNTKVEHPCESNTISFTILTDIVLASIRTEFALYLKKKKYFVENYQRHLQESLKECYKELKVYEKNIERNKQKNCEQYARYKAGDIKQEQYVESRLCLNEELEVIYKEVCRVKEKIQMLEKKEKQGGRAVCALLNIKSGEQLTKELIQALIQRIYIYPGKRVEIIFTFTNEMLEV